jgi:hypothetical protein
LYLHEGIDRLLPLGWWTLTIDATLDLRHFAAEQSATFYTYAEFGREEYPFRLKVIHETESEKK